MFLYTVLVFAFICRIEAHYPNIISNDHRKHLVNVIKNLNGDRDARDERDKQEADLNDDEKEEILQEILRLLKKNYKTAKGQGQDNDVNPVRDEARLYFIRNPEVLDEYKNYLKEKMSSPINYYPSLDNSKYDKNSVTYNMKDIQKAMLKLGLHQNLEDEIDEFDKNEDIQETRKDNFRKLQKEFSLNDENDSTNVPSKRIKENNKNQNNRLRKDDIKLLLNVESDVKSNSDESKNHKSKSKSKSMYLSKKKLKSNRNVEIDTNDNYKGRDKFVSEHKPNSFYRKPKIDQGFLPFGRTHIPIVGKKNIYDDK